MAAPERLNMEELQTMMLAWVDEISTKQTENLNARTDELKELTKKIVDTNSHIDTITENICEITDKQTEQICETMLCEQTIITVSYTHLDVYKRQVVIIKAVKVNYYMSETYKKSHNPFVLFYYYMLVMRNKLLPV